MKKFGKKLILSGLALAATAATLSTTTYAWYVTNPHGDVEGAKAQTAAVANDGSVSLSLTGEENTFFPTIDFADDGAIKTEPASGVSPLTSTDGLTFATGTTSGTPATFTTTAAESGWYSYTFFVKVDAAVSVKMTAVVTNNSSGAQKEQIAYYDGSPVTTGKSFKMDAAKAMYMSVSNYAAAESGYASTPTATTITAFDAESKGITYSVGSSGITTTTESGITGNANTYYKNAKNLNTAPTDYNVTQAALPTLTFAAAGVQKVVVNMWLEGSDTDCFNACAGQSFAVNFDFDIQ